jgi:type II secretory pathway component PulF
VSLAVAVWWALLMAFVHVLALAWLLYELLFVLPRFEKLSKDLNMSLPALPRWSIAVSQYTGKYLWLVATLALSANAWLLARLFQRSRRWAWLCFLALLGVSLLLGVLLTSNIAGPVAGPGGVGLAAVLLGFGLFAFALSADAWLLARLFQRSRRWAWVCFLVVLGVLLLLVLALDATQWQVREKIQDVLKSERYRGRE